MRTFSTIALFLSVIVFVLSSDLHPTPKILSAFADTAGHPVHVSNCLLTIPEHCSYFTVMTHSEVFKQLQRSSELNFKDVAPHMEYLPMSDGVKLYTVWWAPFDGPRPTVMVRSPYGIGGTENFAILYLSAGFQVVMQNARATGWSDGDWDFFGRSAQDGQDTIAWISQQPWSNGVIFEFGASADGMLAYGDLRVPQPHIKGQALVFSTSLPFYTMFQSGGSYRESLVSRWLGIMQSWRPNAPSYVDQVLQHEGWDSFWEARNLRNLSNVDFPAIHVAGWFDIFTRPMIETFTNFQTLSSPGAKGKQRLVVGPRGHCMLFKGSWSNWFPSDYLDLVWLYEYSLQIFGRKIPRELTLTAGLKRITLYIMGSSDFFAPRPETDIGMYWTSLDSWPVNIYRTFYLHSDGTMGQTQQENEDKRVIIFDPKNPVPTVGGNNLFLTCGPEEQSSIENRPVLFTSPVLTEPTIVLGTINVTLFVASNCTDTDFTAKITDVYPNGKSILISDQHLRMRWRNSLEKPVFMQPGNIYEITLELWPIAQVFNSGHRIRLALSSSNWPRFGANLNNGEPYVRSGGPTNIAQNSFIMGGKYPARVVLPLVTADQVPDMYDDDDIVNNNIS